MTTSSDPEQIRAEIEQTRSNLSYDVDALADQANPRNIARRQVDTVKESIRDKGNDLKDRIMGVASDAGDSVRGAADNVRGAAGNVRDAAGNVAGNAQGTVSDVPSTIRRKSQGNPLGAGLVAFGAGLLVSSLIPASQRERQAAVDLKDRAQPLTDKVTDAAKEVAGNLKEPAQQAAASVKDTATQAAQHVKEQSQDSAAEVKGTAQDAQQEVRDSSAAAAGEVKGTAQDAQQEVRDSGAAAAGEVRDTAQQSGTSGS